MTACPALLIVKGEYLYCDWPTDEHGKHPGWLHCNKAAQTLWTDDPANVGESTEPCKPDCEVCTQAAVYLMRDIDAVESVNAALQALD